MATERLPDTFVVHDGTELVYANPAFCTLLGVQSQEQLIGTSLLDLVTSEYQKQLSNQIDQLENNDAPALGVTVELQTVTGQSQRAIVVSSLVEWEGNEHIQSTVLPIAGIDSESRRLLYDQAMDEAPVGITIADPSQPDNPLIYVNDGFCELTGYERDEVLGRNCRFLQGEATRDEPVAQMRTAIDAEEPVAVELRNYRKDGSMFWSRVTITPIRDEAGAVINWFGYQEDITAEKRYEYDLSLFKTQAEASDKMVVVTDAEGIIEYVNPAFERLTGYSAAEATGQTPAIINTDQQDEEFYAQLWENITAGEVWEAELTNQTKYGELFTVNQKIIPVTDEYGEITHFVGIEQDITENKLTTQTLDVLNRVLRHNLRNSLNAIDGHAALLEEDTLDSTARKESVAAIRNQAKSMQKIADQIAQIRAIWDPTNIRSSWETLDMVSLVETYQRQYPDATIQFSGVPDANIDVQNAELLKMALDEAVTNAIKHSEDSPREVRIIVEGDADNNRLQIRVADTGPGIPDIERQAIESDEETPLGHGSGIGLWLMNWITTALRGEMTVADNEPQGSIITFQLPTGPEAIN